MRRSRKCFVSVNEKEEGPYDGVLENSVVFGANGNRVAYGAGIGDQRFVVVYNGPQNLDHAIS